MVVVGADVHKRAHTFVAVGEVGRKLGEKVVKATTDGHRQAVHGVVSNSASTWCGRLRIAGICRRGWNAICSLPIRRWSGCHRS